MSAIEFEAIAPRRVAPPQPRTAARPRPRAWRVLILVSMAVFYVLPLVCAVKFSLINQKGTYGPQYYTAIVNNGALSDALILSLEIAAITAAVAVLVVRRRLAARPRLLSASIGELRRDAAALGGRE